MELRLSCTNLSANAMEPMDLILRQTFIGKQLVAHSDVVGASPVGAAPTTIFIVDLTPGFNGLGKDNCKTRPESFKFWNLVQLILEVLQ